MLKDPTFGRDVSFYVFTLPVLHGIQSALLLIVGVTTRGGGLVYLVRLGVRFGKWGDVPFAALRHLSGLGCALLLLVAFGYVLRNFDLVFSHPRGGHWPRLHRRQRRASAQLADGVHLCRDRDRPAFRLRAAQPEVAGRPAWRLGILAFLVTPLLPVLVQRFVVEPNEFGREEKYIARNIDMTLAGFGLDDVEVTDLTGQDPIVPAELPADEPPLSNVRIWDYRVVDPVYQQLQSFVPYYEFTDIDVDRYTIDGQPVQVLISARELNIDGLRGNRPDLDEPAPRLHPRLWRGSEPGQPGHLGWLAGDDGAGCPAGWSRRNLRSSDRRSISASFRRTGSSSTPIRPSSPGSTRAWRREVSRVHRPGRSRSATRSPAVWRRLPSVTAMCSSAAQLTGDSRLGA